MLYIIRKPFIMAGILTIISMIMFLLFNRVYRDQILVNRAFFREVNIPSLSLVDIVQKSSIRNPSEDDPTFLYRLSSVLLTKGMRKEAIEILMRALKKEPHNPQIKLQLALELFNDERYEEAERSFSELLSHVNTD